MKTQSKKLDSKLEEYYQINEQIKELTKEKVNLKTYLLDKMSDNSLDAINFTATISISNRTQLDTKGIKLFFGNDIVKYQSEIQVQNFKVIKRLVC